MTTALVTFRATAILLRETFRKARRELARALVFEQLGFVARNSFRKSRGELARAIVFEQLDRGSTKFI